MHRDKSLLTSLLPYLTSTAVGSDTRRTEDSEGVSEKTNRTGG